MLDVFQYLYDKKGKKIPLLMKLLNDKPLTNDDYIVDGNINISFHFYKQLPDNLIINGYLDIWGTRIKYLPNNLTVMGNLYANYSYLKDLPDSLIVYGDLSCGHTVLGRNIMTNPELLSKYSKQIKGKIYYA